MFFGPLETVKFSFPRPIKIQQFFLHLISFLLPLQKKFQLLSTYLNHINTSFLFSHWIGFHCSWSFLVIWNGGSILPSHPFSPLGWTVIPRISCIIPPLASKSECDFFEYLIIYGEELTFCFLLLEFSHSCFR